jgi:hypothetical protein
MDRMNPFGEMRNPHIMWPIMMCIFNLPMVVPQTKVSFVDNPHIWS